MLQLEIFLVGGVVLFICFFLLWLLSLLLKDSSIVDIFWGTGFVIVCAFYFLYPFPPHFALRPVLVMGLTLIWGLRLTFHLAIRNIGKPEDYRYQRWREQSGSNWWWWSFFKVFLLQAVVMWIVSYPLLAAQSPLNSAHLHPLDIVALALWLVGFSFEAIGDWQLQQFKKDPNNKGKVLTSGLWQYTRHPNYFGDATIWWSFYLFACANQNYHAIFSPLLMTFLIIKVSGVAMLEEDLQNKKPEYQQYVKNTNAFFPKFWK